MRRLAALLAALCLALGSTAARAGVTEPDARADDAFDFMNVLSRRGLHHLDDEAWNAYGQFTWISSYKAPFSAAYTNLNGTPHSLRTDAEHSYTGTATLYLGARLWRGAELYAVPELILENALSNLKGLGGTIQNFELQKQGNSWPPILYLSRVYLRQTIALGGEAVKKTSDPMQLGTTSDARRIVLTFGNFSVLDLFDKNSFAGDLRKQFLNMAFMTYAAYDFAADARGYSWGGVAELYWDDWAVRFGRMVPPKNPNQLNLDYRFWIHYGDQVEIEHQHAIAGRAGAVRVLGFRNRETMGRFDDALLAFRGNPAKNMATCADAGLFETADTNDPSQPSTRNARAPDLCWARKPNVKVGVGVNLEQEIVEGVGAFLRAMWADGRTEVYSYTSTDRSLAFGVLANGARWRRKEDLVGVGYGVGWISSAHADYLAQGGVDGFIGDGALRRATERVFDVFYALNLFSSVWLSADYQHVWNPAFNADRGGVDILSARAHAEF